MPIYVLMCDECGSERDVFRRIAEIDSGLPSCCGATMHRKVCAPFVRGDQPAYQAVAVDSKTGSAPVIEGRVQHREFLRRNGYVEAADMKPTERTEVRGDFNVRKELTEAVREVMAR